MGKFTTGLVAGGIVGALGLTCALADKKTRQRLTKSGKQMMHKASDMVEKADW